MILLWAFYAYLAGSIPFGLFAGRLARGIDIREHGSKNIGATNVFRVVGKKWGILVFLLDGLKGFAAVSLPLWISGTPLPLQFKTGLACAAILGHTFPVWLKFKGGKGVATSLGVFLAVTPLATVLSFGLWILAFLTSRIISISSLFAALAFPVMCFLVNRRDEGFPVLFAVSLGLAVFIFYTHRANIQRLRTGEEKRLF